MVASLQLSDGNGCTQHGERNVQIFIKVWVDFELEALRLGSCKAIFYFTSLCEVRPFNATHVKKINGKTQSQGN